MAWVIRLNGVKKPVSEHKTRVLARAKFNKLVNAWKKENPTAFYAGKTQPYWVEEQ